MANTIPVTTVKGLYKLTALEALTATDAKDYTADVKGADDRSFFIVDNSDGSQAVTVSLSPGDYSGGDTRVAGEVKAGEKALLYVDSAFCKTEEGLRLSLEPAGVGTKLCAVQFLPVANN